MVFVIIPALAEYQSQFSAVQENRNREFAKSGNDWHKRVNRGDEKTRMRQGELPTTQSGLRQHLQKVTLEEGQKLVIGYLQERASEVLNLMPPRRPEAQHSLNELGFDSMMGMELRHRIVTELEVDIPSEEFIGSSTLAQVAGLLLNQLVLTSVIQSEPLSPGLSDNAEEITL